MERESRVNRKRETHWIFGKVSTMWNNWLMKEKASSISEGDRTAKTARNRGLLSDFPYTSRSIYGMRFSEPDGLVHPYCQPWYTPVQKNNPDNCLIRVSLSTEYHDSLNMRVVHLFVEMWAPRFPKWVFSTKAVRLECNSEIVNWGRDETTNNN